MTYAKRVKSPLKGGVDVELTPKVLLLGANGAGKTAVLQALKLAIKGYVDDQEGKDGVSKTDAIARLFANGEPLVSQVEMSDGTEFSWTATRKTKGFTKPKFKPPYDVNFPFHALKALLSGDDKKIRTWLEEKVSSSLDDDDLIGLLPPAQRDEGKKALAIFVERMPTELAEKLKAEARRLRTGATRQEKTIDQLVEGVPLPLTEEKRQTLLAEKDRLWAEANSPGTMSAAEHQQMRASIERLAEAITQVQVQMEGLPEAREGEKEAAQLAQKARSLVVSHLEGLGHDTCYVCLSKDKDLRETYKIWDDALSKLGASQSCQRLQTQYDTAMQQAQALAARYKSAKVVDTAGLMEEHSAAAATLSADDANRRVWRQAEGAKQEVSGSRASADIFSSLAKTWGSRGKDLLKRRKQEFEDAVMAWLPAEEVFRVDLEAGRVGLLVDGQVRTSLSGAEHSRVLLAVLSAEGALGDGSTPSILEPEDRGWDPDTLVGVMTALTSAPDQVILMSTVPPTGMGYNDQGVLEGEPPEGWQVVEVGA